MSIDTLIGSLAAILTTIAFFPQALAVIRTRKAEGISLLMYGIFTVGVACWLVYGILIASVPILLANSVTLALALVILVMTWRIRRE